MAVATFHRFSELPAELRDTIWELGLPGPARRCPEFRSKPLCGPSSQTKDPAMLQVNRESRAIALQSYERRDHYNCRYGRYFNFELDEFYFAGTEVLSAGLSKIPQNGPKISMEDRQRFKKITLAFPWSFAASSPFKFVRTVGETFLSCLWNFESLQGVTIEIWQDDALDIMDVMAPPMLELEPSTNRMLRIRLTQTIEYFLRVVASDQAPREMPTWRVQVVRYANEAPG
jgi:2EXR family